MKTPKRSAALARALMAETVGLPKDFAAQVAALAEAGGTAWRFSWNDIGLLVAFATMIGICVAGWIRFGEHSSSDIQWLGTIVGALTSRPWLIMQIAGVAFVQALMFRRRTTT